MLLLQELQASALWTGSRIQTVIYWGSWILVAMCSGKRESRDSPHEQIMNFISLLIMALNFLAAGTLGPSCLYPLGPRHQPETITAECTDLTRYGSGPFPTHQCPGQWRSLLYNTRLRHPHVLTPNWKQHSPVQSTPSFSISIACGSRVATGKSCSKTTLVFHYTPVPPKVVFICQIILLSVLLENFH